MIVDECACAGVELFFVVSPICVHLPIYNLACQFVIASKQIIYHIFRWPSCRLQMNINKMNAKREIFRCSVLRGQRQRHSGIQSENSLRPECVVMSFTLLLSNVKDQTGRLVPANTIYVPAYEIIIIHFYCYHNCKWQCQRVERRTSWRIFGLQFQIDNEVVSHHPFGWILGVLTAVARARARPSASPLL